MTRITRAAEMPKTAKEKRWEEIEEGFDSIMLDLQHRCYAPESITGAMYLALLVKRHLTRIEEHLIVEAAKALTGDA